MREILTAGLLLLVLSTIAFSQTGNGALTGTVEDPSKALVPGVSITAANTQTGVETRTLTNEAGAYNLPSLLPGPYKLTAELSGFRTSSISNIELGTGESKRFNFTLQLSTAAQSVDVNIDATNLLAVSSATIGEVLPESKVRDLPLVCSDILDLIGILGGARVSALGGSFTTFAGITADYVNTTVNGQSVGDGRYTTGTGVYSTVRLSPDMVGEVRLILTPVDAEMGRGNGQVQIQTRSGTNAFRGSAVDNIRNTAFDARSWLDNRTVPLPTRNWTNQHQFSLSYSGPIVKNKTFFFVLWDQQITRIRENVAATVLTDCARNGIFRYFPDWNNGNTSTVASTVPTTSGSAVTPVVDVFGNPKPPATFRNGNTYTGSLQYASVYGPLPAGWTPATPDCSDAPIPASAWDPFRPNLDPSGFVTKTMNLMPHANAFDQGDGLNTAVYRWQRSRKGNDEVSGGTEDNTNRKSINVRIDQNFSSRHKINGNLSYERDDSVNSGPNWPNGFWGSIQRRPYVGTVNFTSTLSPTLLNEARFGVRYNKGVQYEALDDPTYGKAAREYLPNINGIPVVVGLGTGITNFQASVLANGDFTRGNLTPLWTYGDTLSWTKGKHGFKFGGEVRFAKSDGWSNLNFYPHATGGVGTAGTVPLPTFSNSLSGMLTTNNTGMGNLLTFLSGSIGSVTQLYFLQTAQNLSRFEDLTTQSKRDRDFRQHEWSAFFKDDWKVDKRLTLNLGLRYEYYGSPFEAHGLTAAPVGGGNAVFGYSGRSFADWFSPGQRGEDLAFEFVGPHSPHPDRSLIPADRNNFGPAVGFAWQVPWFGEGRTTVRGGYQVTYQGGGRTFDLDLALGYAPGQIATPSPSAGNTTFVRVADLQNFIPVPNSLAPMETVPNTRRATIAGWSNGVYDPNYVAPYVQNFTLSLTRSIRRNITLDFRYIGTRGVKLYADLPLNSRNFVTNGLQEAFDAARSGGESDLLDAMFNGINVAGTGCNGVAGSATCGRVGTTFAGLKQTGAMHLRASPTFQANLANGNYSALAGSLYTLNYNTTFSGNSALPVIPTDDQGAVLRLNGFPENYISANPQFNTISLKTNLNRSTYHGLQAQFNLQQTKGFSYQGTFTWSKSLGSPPNGGFQDPRFRTEYGLLFGHRSYDFRSNGGIELPIGPSKLLLRNSTGWLARVVERWQSSFILQMTSGRPNTISAANMLFQGTGTPVVTPEGVAYFGPFPQNFGKVYWPKGAAAGSYFPPDTFVRVDDPQCAEVTNLQNLNGLSGANPSLRCTLDALARPLPAGTTGVPGQIVLPDGRPGLIVLQNPLPGQRGTLGLNTMQGPGLWFFDAAMSKTFRIDESKSVQVRVDAKNVLNHPTPDDPGQASCLGLGTNLSLISTSDFGRIGGKCVAESPARRLQAGLRINF